ncbi:MAG TPA: class I adenylate-forming enzyme family protein [Acidimicrobiales bacterium]
MDLLIGDVFRAAARAVPGRIAVALGDRTITYAELDRAANQHTHALTAMGIQPRDRVVLWSNTSIDAAPLFAGLAKAGIVFAPANALLGVDEAIEMVSMAKPAALVVDDAHHDAGEKVAVHVGVPLLRLGQITDAQTPATEPPRPPISERDLHVLFFTSGSTGRSKGVMLSHRVNYLRTHPGSQLEPRGPTVCMYPLFHMGAWTIALQAWQTQTTLVLVPQADARLVCEAVERWRATHLNAIPAVWQRILQHLRDSDRSYDLSSLRLVDSGTSATPPELLDAIKAAVPSATRRVFYGSTEAGAVTLLRDEDMARKPGSCGVPQHSCDVRIDEQTGELLVRGPLLFDGYFDDPDATAAAFTPDGWFRTGDVAAEDDEGYLSIVGRVRDVIRTGGETVAPSEVEAALADHPAIADVAVVGIPDPQWGEIVCAAIVVADRAAAPTLDDLLDHCASRLAKFKRPRRLEVVDHIPRTPATNQVQRRLLVERITS